MLGYLGALRECRKQVIRERPLIAQRGRTMFPSERRLNGLASRDVVILRCRVQAPPLQGLRATSGLVRY
jgi:hypothetical protein